MLESLRIRNFRLFEDLRIPKLGRVNLVVGKNHSGKSCLLEAVYVYAERGHESVLRKLVRDRREDVGAVLALRADLARSELQEAMDNPIRNLFIGRRFPDDNENSIIIGRDEGEYPLLRITPFGIRASSSADSFRVDGWDYATLGSLEKLHEAGTNWVGKPVFILNSAFHRSERVVEVDHETSLVERTWNWQPTEGEPEGLVRHIAASGWSDTDVAALWAPISVRPSLRRIVRDALRLIEPEIEEIVMVPGREGSAAEPIAVYSDDLQVPLRALGEGIGRLFRIAMALAGAKGGYVLIDEFENGLHWEVQPKAWEIVFKLAAELDIQVFATTHSLDCVKAFQQTDAATPGTLGMVHRLGRSVRKSERGKVTVRSYEGEALQMAVSAGMEVR